MLVIWLQFSAASARCFTNPFHSLNLWSWGHRKFSEAQLSPLKGIRDRPSSFQHRSPPPKIANPPQNWGLSQGKVSRITNKSWCFGLRGDPAPFYEAPAPRQLIPRDPEKAPPYVYFLLSDPQPLQYDLPVHFHNIDIPGQLFWNSCHPGPGLCISRFHTLPRP
jgi:hypothetical protein